MEERKHITLNEALSYNGIITEIISNRNGGKTWGAQRRAWRRFQKTGHKTVWIRTFEDEYKECKKKIYGSIKLQKYCGIEPYNPETKQGNFKKEGSTMYGKRGNKWDWFLQIYNLSKANSVRGVDDPKIDTIVWDEFMCTPEKYRRYSGDMITDFMDIFLSIKREHEVRIICLGNKESTICPLNTYFGIKPLPVSFEGIRTYRNGSFVIQQINNIYEERSDYDKKVNDLFNGTKYGNYLKGASKQNKAFRARKTPTESNIWAQVYMNGYGLKISVLNGLFYLSRNVDVTREVFCDELANKFKKEYKLVSRQKPYFRALVEAVASNRVYYDNEATFEAAQKFFKWLGC